MSELIRQTEIDATKSGASEYLLLDEDLKERLAKQNLKEPFDRSKHKILLRIEKNHKGEIFASFFFKKA